MSVVERVNVRKTAVEREILIVKKLKERRVAAERQAKREAARREAVRLRELEEQRVAKEEASFLEQLAADRKREREAREAAEREAARLRELEEQRIASEEASFLKQLAADQKREREEAARQRAAEAAAKKEQPKPEPQKIINVEKPAEPAKKAEPAPVLAALAKAKRKPEVVACETRLEETAKAGTVLFALNSADLLKDAVITLDALSAAVRACGRLRVVIEGHTDSTGLVGYNQGLSERRAENVANYLISAGVKAGNVQFIGYGELRPVASNANRAGRAKNRRIEYRVR